MFYGRRNSKVQGYVEKAVKIVAKAEGVEGAIDKFLQPTPKIMPASYRIQVGRFVKQGRPIFWNGQLINPPKLDISRLNINNKKGER